MSDLAAGEGVVSAYGRWAPPVLLVLVLGSFALPALDQYNATWDEALGDYFFGERYLSFFTSFDSVYLDFDRDPYPPEREPNLFISPLRTRPWEYYPVANVLAAATSEVLSRRLGLLDPFDGYHAVNLFFAAALILGLYPFLRRRLGALTAVLALGLLFTLPRVFAHLMANIKDFPLMALYALTVIAFHAAYERGSVRGLLGAGALWGLALGTKANALFLPGIPLLLILIAELPEPWRGRRLRLWAASGAAGVLGVAVMIAVWPYLWADPLGRLLKHYDYIRLRGSYTTAEPISPLQAVLQTTPVVFLALALVGFLVALPKLRRRDRTAWLPVLWIAVSMSRYLHPDATNFDGVRHFLELFPPLAILAAWGAVRLIRRIVRQVERRFPEEDGARGSRTARLRALLAGVVLLPGAWTILATHPFQICYWNALVGGYGGAYEKGLPGASDYWGMSYRVGIDWLDENAPPGAYLAVPVIEHAVRLVARQRLRDDLRLLRLTTPFAPTIEPRRLARTRALAAEAPVYVMFVDRRAWRNELMVDCLVHLEPQVLWSLDGAPVLFIYRYDPSHSGAGRSPHPDLEQRHRHERQQEHHQGHPGDGPPPGIQGDQLVAHRGVGQTHHQDDQTPQQPPGPDQRHQPQRHPQREGETALETAGGGVEDVTAVELPQGQ